MSFECDPEDYRRASWEATGRPFPHLCGIGRTGRETGKLGLGEGTGILRCDVANFDAVAAQHQNLDKRLTSHYLVRSVYTFYFYNCAANLLFPPYIKRSLTRETFPLSTPGISFCFCPFVLFFFFFFDSPIQNLFPQTILPPKTFPIT